MSKDEPPVGEKMDQVGLFLRAMVDREPGKRKVKASKAALIDLAQLDMALGDSSDDSDFNVDEAKLNEDDDISINSDPENDNGGPESESASSEECESDNEHEEAFTGELSIGQLLERADLATNREMLPVLSKPKILVCAVCLGDNSDDTNEIVTCDGWCHVSVHEGCYGVSDNVSVSSTVSSCSTEPWFCDACKAGVQNPSCELCPNLGNSIFKETEMGRWVHLVCALYVPGVAFSEVDKLSFPTLFEMAYNRYGSKVCSLCEDVRYSKTGVCIGCDAGMCRSYFHVTCAQKHGLLSEVNHGEADQADPYYAHCKLHTDKELIKRRKRNWLTLQLNTKRNGELPIQQKEQSRLDRKLGKYRDKYNEVKAARPTPWFPTQKMPRSINTSASIFRTLLHKTKLMGLETETQEAELVSPAEIRKKWHIPPAFNVEFISYYIDRGQRLKEQKDKLEAILVENKRLTEEDEKEKSKLDEVERKNKELLKKKDTLLSKSLELHNLLKGLAGRPLPLPPLVASLHNPPPPPTIPPCINRVNQGGRETRRIITKAAAKMIADPIPTFTELQESTKPSNIDSSPATAINVLTKPPLPPSFQTPTKSTRSTAQSFPISKEFKTPSPVKVLNNKGDSSKETSNVCSVCKGDSDQHLQIQCDACILFYHLRCLDPPLSRMPKKTKQMGWQCSDCNNLDMEKAAVVDVMGPRRLRRVIKEPNKFSPAQLENKPDGSSPSDGPASKQLESTSSPKKPDTSPKNMKRRRSSDGNKKIGQSVSPNSQKRSRKMLENNSSSGITSPNNNDKSKSEEELLKESKIAAAINEAITITPTVAPPSLPTITSPVSIAPVAPKLNDFCKDIIDGSVSITPTTKAPTGIIQSLPTTIANEMSVVNDSNHIRTQSSTSSSTKCNESKTKESKTDSKESKTENNESKTESKESKTENNESKTESKESKTEISSGLDLSADSLPSASSVLHSPTSESLNSVEDENPLSPRKEKRHRDGSKKKKKDKSTEKGEKRRKKHHHYWGDNNSQSSEMLAPLRLKIKPLPPRPLSTDSSPLTLVSTSEAKPPPAEISTTTKAYDASTTHAQVSVQSVPSPSHGTTPTQVAPPGYPPLPPGYTLTQPMLLDAEAILNDKSSNGGLSTSGMLSGGSRRSSGSGSSCSAAGVSNVTVASSHTGRRKSDCNSSAAQQFSICDVCKEAGGVTNTVKCDECHKAYHFNCLEPPLKKTPKRRGYSWFCEDCEPK